MKIVTFNLRCAWRGDGINSFIHYIFLSEAMRGRVTAVAPWQDEHAGIYLSDHFPVCLSLT